MWALDEIAASSFKMKLNYTQTVSQFTKAILLPHAVQYIQQRSQFEINEY